MSNEAYISFGGAMVFLDLGKVVDLAKAASYVNRTEHHESGRSGTYQLRSKTGGASPAYASYLEIHAEGRAKAVLDAFAMETD